MERPKLEVAEVFRRYGSAYRQKHAGSLSRGQRRVMSAIELCRTAALGGHLEQCDACGHQRPAYNSCRDRHCPKCQSLARARWLADRQAELLPVPYFHVVFTVPEEIAAIAYQNKEVVYGILFRATAETLRTIAADPKHLGAAIGFLAVLHSWGQNLLFHPHLHCVVPGGGISPDGQRWITCRPEFFLPVRVLSRLFRRLFLEHLQAAFDKGKLQFFSSLERLRDPQAFAQYLAPLGQTDWVVYAKPPFGGPQQVLNYLGRYVPAWAESFPTSPSSPAPCGALSTNSTARSQHGCNKPNLLVENLAHLHQVLGFKISRVGRLISGVAPIGYGPVLLLVPFGFHLTMHTVPSGLTVLSPVRPARHYPPLSDMAPLILRERDFKPPEHVLLSAQCAFSETALRKSGDCEAAGICGVDISLPALTAGRAFANAHGISCDFLSRKNTNRQGAHENVSPSIPPRGAFMILIGRAPPPVWRVKRDAQGAITEISHPKSPR